MSLPIAGTFTIRLGAACCTLPYDATPEEVTETVEELGQIDNHISVMKKNWPHLNEVTADVHWPSLGN